MLKTLRLAPPKPSYPGLRANLLEPLPFITDELAAVFLRFQWDHFGEAKLAHNGLLISRRMLYLIESNSKITTIPIRRGKSREILLGLFKDGSLLVFRLNRPAPAQPTSDDMFHILPTCLRLTDARHFPGVAGRIHLSIRPGTPSPTRLIIQAQTSEGATDLFARARKSQSPARLPLRRMLAASAVAWTNLIADLPVLYRPPQGFGYLPESLLEAEQKLDLNIDDDQPCSYACPAAMPFRCFDARELVEQRSYLQDASDFLFHSMGRDLGLSSLEVDVVADRLFQRRVPVEPRIRILTTPSLSDEQSLMLRNAVISLLKHPAAPITWKRLVGQDLASDGTTLLDVVIGVGISRSGKPISNHAIMGLYAKFSP